MNSILKNCLFTVTAIGASVLPSFAGVTAKVPFDFVAGSTRFSAGVYTFEENESGLLVVSGGARRTVNFVAGVVNGNATAQTSAVKFDKVDGEYHLSRVSDATDATSLLMPAARKTAASR